MQKQSTTTILQCIKLHIIKKFPQAVVGLCKESYFGRGFNPPNTLPRKEASLPIYKDLTSIFYFLLESRWSGLLLPFLSLVEQIRFKKSASEANFQMVLISSYQEEMGSKGNHNYSICRSLFSCMLRDQISVIWFRRSLQTKDSLLFLWMEEVLWPSIFTASPWKFMSIFLKNSIVTMG